MKNKLFYALIVTVIFATPLLFAQDEGSDDVFVDIPMPGDFSADQSQQQKPQPPPATSKRRKPLPQQPPQQKAENKISLDVKGMDIVDVLKMLATRAGMNLVVGRNVTGRVTLFLKDVSVDDAFEIILLANDLAYEEKEGIINVMTQRDFELIYGERYQDKKQLKIMQLKYVKAADISRALGQIKTNLGKIVVDEGSNTVVIIDTPQKIKEMEEIILKADLPTETRIFGLNYAQADKLSAKLQDAVTKGVGSVKIDERTNKVVVTDFPQKLDEIAKIIEAFDEKTPQVLIDAQIIELRPSDAFDMGVDFNYWINKYIEVKAKLPGLQDAWVGTPQSGTVTQPGDYKVMIDFLRTIVDTKVLSSPRIMALNNQEAKILVGTKEAYITSTTSQGASGQTVKSQTVNFVDVGLKLFVTPTINRDGFVTMKIRPEVSSSDTVKILSEDEETEVPIVTTSEAETTVMVKEGVTVIIGGLKQDKREKTTKRIPILGDIPILGYLFGSTSDTVSKTELVIFLTPHIMSGEKAFVDLEDAMPKDGARSNMVKGKIVTDRIIETQKEEEDTSKIMDAMSKSTAPAKTRDSAVKQAPQPAKVAKVVSDYNSSVIDKIRSLASDDLPKKKGEAEVTFVLLFNGNLKSDPVVVSSTDKDIGKNAVECIKKASPFEKFPPELRKIEESFHITLKYD